MSKQSSTGENSPNYSAGRDMIFNSTTQCQNNILPDSELSNVILVILENYDDISPDVKITDNKIPADILEKIEYNLLIFYKETFIEISSPDSINVLTKILDDLQNPEDMQKFVRIIKSTFRRAILEYCDQKNIPTKDYYDSDMKDKNYDVILDRTFILLKSCIIQDEKCKKYNDNLVNTSIHLILYYVFSECKILENPNSAL